MRWGRRVKTLPRLLATNHLLHQEVSRLTKQSCSTLEDVENYHNRSSAETRGQAIRAVFSALILKLVAAGIAKKARDGLWHLGQLIDKLYLLNPLYIQASTIQAAELQKKKDEEEEATLPSGPAAQK